jgi:TolB-like protein
VYVEAGIGTSAYRRLATFPFTTSGYAGTSHRVADEVVVALLENVPELELIDRSHIERLVWDGDISETLPEDAADALKVGRLLGVDAIMVGSVTLSLDTITPVPGEVWRVANGVAVVRLFDAEDGRIVWAKRIERDNSVLVNFHGDTRTWDTDHDVVDEVITELAHAIAGASIPTTRLNR